jgi:hypothetical protein
MIVAAAIEELSETIECHPAIKKTLGAIRGILEDALDTDRHVLEDERALQNLAEITGNCAQTLGLTVKMDMIRGSSDVLKSTQITLTQTADLILGREPTDPPEAKEFERLGRTGPGPYDEVELIVPVH